MERRLVSRRPPCIMPEQARSRACSRGVRHERRLPQRASFPADPRADQRAGPHPAARSTGRRSTIAAPTSPRSRPRSWKEIRPIFKTAGPVVIYPASGTGAWEAALVNTLSPGDRVLMAETGHFASLWCEMARAPRARGRAAAGRLAAWRRSRAGRGDARRGPRPSDQGGLRRPQRDLDRGHLAHRRGPPRDRPRRPPGPVHGRHDLLARLDRLSPRRVGRRRHGRGLAEGPDAAARPELQCGQRQGAGGARRARGCRGPTGTGQPMLAANAKGVFPYTPATNLLYGLREALAMLHEEGLEQVFARHDRHAEATRRAVRAWGLELLCQDPREYSSSLTAVLMPDGPGRRRAAPRSSSSASTCRSATASAGSPGRVFRIGHLGDFNDLMLAGTLAGIEMGLRRFGHRANASGVVAALDHLAAERVAEPRRPGERRLSRGPETRMELASAARLLDLLAARHGLVAAVGAGGKKSTLYRLAEAHRLVGSARVGLTCTVSMGPPPQQPDRRAAGGGAGTAAGRGAGAGAPPSPAGLRSAVRQAGPARRAAGRADRAAARRGRLHGHADQGRRRAHALDQGAARRRAGAARGRRDRCCRWSRSARWVSPSSRRSPIASSA